MEIQSFVHLQFQVAWSSNDHEKAEKIKWWIGDINKIMDNIEKTSLNKEDRDKRILELFTNLSKRLSK